MFKTLLALNDCGLPRSLIETTSAESLFQEIQVSFLDFDIEGDVSCRYDSMTVFIGGEKVRLWLDFAVFVDLQKIVLWLG